MQHFTSDDPPSMKEPRIEAFAEPLSLEQNSKIHTPHTLESTKIKNITLIILNIDEKTRVYRIIQGSQINILNTVYVYLIVYAKRDWSPVYT